MLLALETLIRNLPTFKLELHNDEIALMTHNFFVVKAIAHLSKHFKYNFKMLTCISGLDYPNSLQRFRVVYELLSLKYNSRIRVKILADELIPVDTIESIIPGASWWESETWDMLGVFFDKQQNLVRLLTDYGFEGYPLRKDFPLSGFLESRYSPSKRRVVYESVELSQEYRVMNFFSVWEKPSR